MELLKAISERRSYRALSPEALPDGAALRIVEAGALSPSCYNNQPWRIVVASSAVAPSSAPSSADSEAGCGALEALRLALADGNAWARRAPVIIAIAVRASDDCRLDDGRDYALFDAGLCAMSMMLQASAEGLVAHPIAGYSPKKAKAALGIPGDYVIASLLIVARRGTVADDGEALSPWQKTAETAPRERKPLSAVASFGSWASGTP